MDCYLGDRRPSAYSWKTANQGSKFYGFLFVTVLVAEIFLFLSLSLNSEYLKIQTIEKKNHR